MNKSLYPVASDKVGFIQNGQVGDIVKPQASKANNLAGLLSKYKKTKPVNIEEMDQVIARPGTSKMK